MPKLIKFSIILLLLLNVFSIGILTVSAADPASTQTNGFVPTPHGNLPTNGCPSGSNCGNYTLNDMVGVTLIVANFILGIVGSLALLAFIVGGLMWLLSAGKPEMVQRGKQTIIGAVVGLVIVFTSFMIIQLVFSALGIPNTSAGQWAVSNWFK